MIEKDEEGYIQDVSHISCLFFFHICAMKTVDYNNTLCQTKGFMVASFLRNPVLYILLKIPRGVGDDSLVGPSRLNLSGQLRMGSAPLFPKTKVLGQFNNIINL